MVLTLTIVKPIWPMLQNVSETIYTHMYIYIHMRFNPMENKHIEMALQTIKQF